LERTLFLDADPTVSHPLTIDPAGTIGALFVALLTLATFWIAREVVSRGHVRPIARTIGAAGLAVSVAAIVFARTSQKLFYGIWDAGEFNTHVFGPFVNRNHMATWLVMAIPLASGYLAAHLARKRSLAGADAVAVWVGASVCAMFAALVASLSRSGTIGLTGAALCAALIAARRGRGSGRWLAAVAAVALLVFVSMPISSQLLARFDRAEDQTVGRMVIWRETLPIVRNFAWTGVGLGAYRSAMLVYQQTDRTRLFNQAHDEYLQLAAEGGLLVCVPLGAALVSFAALGRRRLREDETDGFWIRAGAAAGLAGVAVQNIFETGLRMPANSLLLAVLCAIVAHRTAGTSGAAGRAGEEG
jgi:hypothetical protein